MRTIMGFGGEATATPVSPVAPHQQEHLQSLWHSPVPYLLGSLAAMMGLIAFALLILACSYWKKISNCSNGGRSSGDGNQGVVKGSPLFDQKVLVIMAGDQNPSFLATPMPSTASSYGNNSDDKKIDGRDYSKEKEQEEQEQEHETTEN